MKTPIRLDENLVHDAEIEGGLYKRTAPGQIEYWAEIGKQIDGLLTSSEILAITQGFAHLKLENTASSPIDADDIFTEVNNDRNSENLSLKVTKAHVYYEVSSSRQGLIDRVNDNGIRESGYFRDGQFIVSIKSE